MKHIPMPITEKPMAQYIERMSSLAAPSPDSACLALMATASYLGYDDYDMASWQVMSHSKGATEIRSVDQIAKDIQAPCDAAHSAIIALTHMLDFPFSMLLDIPSLSWMLSSQEQGYDMRDIVFFPNLVVVSDSVHDRTGYDADDYIASCAVIAPSGLSSHEKMALTPTLEIAAELLNKGLPDNLLDTCSVATPHFPKV